MKFAPTARPYLLQIACGITWNGGNEVDNKFKKKSSLCEQHVEFKPENRERWQGHIPLQKSEQK